MEKMDKEKNIILEVSDKEAPFEGYYIVNFKNDEFKGEKDYYMILQDKEDSSYWYVKYFNKHTEPRYIREDVMKYLGDQFAQMYDFRTHENKIIYDKYKNKPYYATEAAWSDKLGTVSFPRIDKQKDISYYKAYITSRADSQSFDKFCEALMFDMLFQNQDRISNNLVFTKYEDGLRFDFIPDNEIGTEYNITNAIVDKYLLADMEEMDSLESNLKQIITTNKKVYDSFVQKTDIEKICKLIKDSKLISIDEKNFLQKEIVKQFQKIKDIDK